MKNFNARRSVGLDVVGDFFRWLQSQDITGEQFHAAHQSFKAGVLLSNVAPKKKVDDIVNAIAEVIQSHGWQLNSNSFSRFKKTQIAIYAMLHQKSPTVPAFQCINCSHGVGLFIRCSGYPKNCDNRFHVGCATSFVEQTKTRYKRYYCKSCSLRIDQRQFKAKKKQPKQAAAKKPPPKKQKGIHKEPVSASSGAAASSLLMIASKSSIENAAAEKKVKRPRHSAASTDSPSALNDDDVREVFKPKRQALKISQFDWLSPFLGCDVIMDGLMQLERDPNLQASSPFFGYYLMLLENLRRGQGCIYNVPTKFKNYYEAQERELKQNSAFKAEASPERKAKFVEQIGTKFRATYANMFTRNEMVVISCLLAYTGFSFCNIDQKLSQSSQSNGITRGMAFVPAQLESFFFKRLRMLGLIDDVAHPKYMGKKTWDE
jgi:hypothetical protein